MNIRLWQLSTINDYSYLVMTIAMKNNNRNIRTWKAFLALTATCCLTLMTGCRDSLLPTEGETPGGNHGTGTYRLLVTVANPDDMAPTPLHVFTIIPGTGVPGDLGGRDPIDLAFGTITASPSSHDGKVALFDYERNLITLHNGTTGKHLLPDIPLAYGTKIVEASLAISPDGKMIAYGGSLEDGDESNDIPNTRKTIVATTDGTTLASITPGVADLNYIYFSPDGTKIAYFAEVADGDPSIPNGAKLYVANVDGTNVHEVATTVRIDNQEGANTFDWSPDGTKIVYVDPEHGNMFIVNSDGTGRQSLGIGLCPDWSPDGKSILFTNQQLQVVKMAIEEDGTTTTPLGIRGIYPRWSPDGKQILYFEMPAGSTDFEELLTVHTLNLETKENLQVVVTKPPFVNWLG